MDIAHKMQDAGLAYEVTNASTPLFLLTGGDSVVAFWRDWQTGRDRAFAGFWSGPEAEVTAQKVRRMSGVYAAYVVRAESVNQ